MSPLGYKVSRDYEQVNQFANEHCLQGAEQVNLDGPQLPDWDRSAGNAHIKFIGIFYLNQQAGLKVKNVVPRARSLNSS